MPTPKSDKYNEGPEVSEKFEQAMKLLFQTPKSEVEKKQPKATLPKSKTPDKN
jgi:hypothetical protein